jgi:glycerol-3-phosphate acyltransferase PlsX
MKIVVDAMGSDNYPDPEIRGAILAVEQFGIEVILVGDEELVEPRLQAANLKNLPISIHHAPDMVEMTDKAVESARQKPNNSMAIGLELVKKGEAAAFVTAGNTGAAMFNALRKLGRIKGVLRPALSGIFPVKNGKSILIDLGANADCRPDFLYQFAVMGSIYANKVLKIEHPRVGLISNGEEQGKGNQLVKDTFPLLKNSDLNFVGNVEGKEFYAGLTDVAVTDGFTGNVMLKSSEAVAKLITDTLKEELNSTPRTKLGAALAMPAFAKIKKMMDPSESGAAPLLGIDGLVFVGHGRSDEIAMMNAIKIAKESIEMDLLTALSEAIQSKFF